MVSCCLFTDGYLVENTLQASEQDIHLEDFFWTGSGDGPSFIKHPLVPLSNNPQSPNTIVRTATILATVYVDGNFVSINGMIICTMKLIT